MGDLAKEKKKRRGHNQGSIFQRKDGRWCAVITLGYENGKLKRKNYYGKTQQEVEDRLDSHRHGVVVEPRPRPSDRVVTERRSRPGYVYIIGPEQIGEVLVVKIGHAANVGQRRREFQTGFPFTLRVLREWPAKDSARLETWLHKRLAKYRIDPRREWFRLPKDVFEMLIALRPEQLWSELSLYPIIFYDDRPILQSLEGH